MNGHYARQAKGIEIGKVEKGRDKANRGARRRTLEEGEGGTYSSLHGAMDDRSDKPSDLRPL
ncbi:hypothetical protein BDV09DRAFT_134906 [Aspergillus tetrazonus]